MEGHFLCHAEGHDVDAGLAALTKSHSEIISPMSILAEHILTDSNSSSMHCSLDSKRRIQMSSLINHFVSFHSALDNSIVQDRITPTAPYLMYSINKMKTISRCCAVCHQNIDTSALLRSLAKTLLPLSMQSELPYSCFQFVTHAKPKRPLKSAATTHAIKVQ